MSTREIIGHTYSYISDEKKFNKYYTFRAKDGWNVIYESNDVNGNEKLTKIFIPDELYAIFSADKAIKELSQ